MDGRKLMGSNGNNQSHAQRSRVLPTMPFLGQQTNFSQLYPNSQNPENYTPTKKYIHISILDTNTKNIYLLLSRETREGLHNLGLSLLPIHNFCSSLGVVDLYAAIVVVLKILGTN